MHLTGELFMSQCRKNLVRGKVIDGASQEEYASSAGDSLIPESGRSPGEENSNTLSSILAWKIP